MNQTDQPSPPDRLVELGELVDQIGELAFSRLDALDVVVAELRTKVAELTTPSTDDPDKTLVPKPWATTATDVEWDVLYEWIDWMVDTYGISARALPACWPAHPGLVEELAGLRSGWVQARLACRTGASDQMSYWHDRCLYPLLDRIKGGTVYGLGDCAQGRHKPIRQDAHRTDRHARTAGSAGERP